MKDIDIKDLLLLMKILIRQNIFQLVLVAELNPPLLHYPQIVLRISTLKMKTCACMNLMAPTGLKLEAI